MRLARSTLAVFAGLCLLLAGASPVAGDDHVAEDDPFADESPLFEDDAEDPFTDLEERATLEDEDDDASEDEPNASETSEDEEDGNAIPFPLVAALAGIALAAWIPTRRSGG